MVEGSIASLFVDISLRGGRIFDDMAKRVDAMDAALDADGAKYKQLFAIKMMGMAELAKRQRQLYQMDVKEYATQAYYDAERENVLKDMAARQATLVQQGQRMKAASDEVGSTEHQTLLTMEREYATYDKLTRAKERLVKLEGEWRDISSSPIYREVREETVRDEAKGEQDERRVTAANKLLDLQVRLDALKSDPTFAAGAADVAGDEAQVAQTERQLRGQERLVQVQGELNALRSDPAFEAQAHDVAKTEVQADQRQTEVRGRNDLIKIREQVDVVRNDPDYQARQETIADERVEGGQGRKEVAAWERLVELQRELNALRNDPKYLEQQEKIASMQVEGKQDDDAINVAKELIRLQEHLNRLKSDPIFVARQQDIATDQVQATQDQTDVSARERLMRVQAELDAMKNDPRFRQQRRIAAESTAKADQGQAETDAKDRLMAEQARRTVYNPAQRERTIRDEVKGRNENAETDSWERLLRIQEELADLATNRDRTERAAGNDVRAAAGRDEIEAKKKLIRLQAELNAMQSDPVHQEQQRRVTETTVRTGQTEDYAAEQRRLLESEEKLNALRSDPDYLAKEAALHDMRQQRTLADIQAELELQKIRESQKDAPTARKVVEETVRVEQGKKLEDVRQDDAKQTAVAKEIKGNPDYMAGQTKIAQTQIGATKKRMENELALQKVQTQTAKSPEYRDMMKAQTALAKEGGRTKAAQDWQRLVAEQGTFVAGLSKVQEKMAGITQVATVMYAAASAGILGAVGAASPETFSTFTGSLRLVAAEIGTIFVPAIIQVSYYIQQVANWFRDLDPAMKSTIATWSMWGVGIAGGIMILGRMLPILIAVTKAIGVLGPALMSMATMGVRAFAMLGAAAMANPIVAGIMAAVAAVGLLIAGIIHLGQTTEREIGTATENLGQLAAGGQLTERQFQRLPARLQSQLLGASPEQRQEILQRELTQVEQELPEAQQRAADAPQRIAEAQAQSQENSGVASFLQGLIGVGGGPAVANSGQNSQMRAARDDQRRVLELQERAAVIRGVQAQGVPGAPGSRPSGSDAQNAPQTSSNWQASFQSFENAWRTMQTSAASGGSIEQRMLDIQTENRQHLENISLNTGTIANKPPPKTGSGQ